MDPSDFTNSGETRLAVSRIITWTTEPKSADVRKESAAVIVALFELNTPEFSMMLTVLPKSFQVMDKISLSFAFLFSALLSYEASC
ncbi:CLIP-associating protein 2-like [Orbicella faveolata]|uniref:CLIP-associating protein 2-like n=1 Tax=Orbicella faveolata TaxID=48498 RepID=UPI0009E1913A|nr:CLIP-associating protein 2-like [Orbicella faveolata]